MVATFTKITAVAGILAIAPAAVSALQYQGYSNTVSCSGDFFFCNDGGAVCCSLPTGFGFSAQFNSLPSGSQGQGYTGSGCSSFLFSVFGSGTKCWNGGGARATHLNWFHSPQRRSVEARAAVPDAPCAVPDSFSYTDDAGVSRVIRVPGNGKNMTEAENIVTLRRNDDFEALAKYELY